MNVHQKLMRARLILQGKKLSKSGHNKFAGYQYFELGDFLPTVQEIFAELGLCGTVSFSADLATLTVVDAEKPETSIVFTSPMGSANLKGCHEVQNIGAVETYQRRYLWVSAMEIVEHDALDAMTGKEPAPKAAARATVIPAAAKSEGLSDERKLSIQLAASLAVNWFQKDDEIRAYEEVSGIADPEEKLYLWEVLKPHSALRASIKKLAQADKETV